MSGSKAGPYRLVSQIGAGGMGVVYLAERDQDFEQKVAVKVLLNSIDQELIDRFRAEKQALAALNHPNIVRLLDAGVMDGGAPYIAMELVDGKPLDRYAADHSPDLETRLRLIMQVLDAVAYAHSQLLAHCDLKYSNVLVTPDGQVRLLDFGIAKLLNPAQYGFAKALTRLYRPFTPEFASPEQLQGAPLTITTDVYTTGVLLYGLLTGEHPFESLVMQPVALVDAICTATPDAPSVRLRHLATPPVPPDSVLKDLDAIVMKALRKNGEDRYRSALEFRDDLERFLDGRPVKAHRGSAWYHVRKFCVRRPALSASVAVMLAAAVAGGSATVINLARAERDRERAEAAFRDVRGVSNKLTANYFAQLARVPGSTEVQQLLVSKSLVYLEKLAAGGARTVDLSVDIAEGYVKLAEIQGDPYENNLGQPDAALASLDRALKLVEPLAVQGGAPAPVRTALGRAHMIRGDVLISMGRAKEAVEDGKLAAAMLDQVASDSPGDIDAQMLAAESWEALGDKLGSSGLSSMLDSTGAVDAFRHSRDRFRAAAQIQPALLRPRRAPFGLSVKMADQIAQNDPAGAIPVYQEAISYFNSNLTPDEQNQFPSRRAMGFALRHLGETLVELQRFREASQYLESSGAIAESLLAIDPRNSRAQWDLAVAHHSAAGATRGLGDHRATLKHLEKVIGILDHMAGMRESLQVKNNLADSLGMAAGECIALGDRARGEQLARRGLALLKALAGTPELSPASQSEVAGNLLEIEPASFQDPVLARQLLERCTANGSSGNPRARVQLAEAMWRTGSREDAKALARKVLAELSASRSTGPGQGWASRRAQDILAR